MPWPKGIHSFTFCIHLCKCLDLGRKGNILQKYFLSKTFFWQIVEIGISTAEAPKLCRKAKKKRRRLLRLIHRYTSQDFDWSNKCALLKITKQTLKENHNSLIKEQSKKDGRCVKYSSLRLHSPFLNFVWGWLNSEWFAIYYK